MDKKSLQSLSGYLKNGSPLSFNSESHESGSKLLKLKQFGEGVGDKNNKSPSSSFKIEDYDIDEDEKILGVKNESIKDKKSLTLKLSPGMLNDSFLSSMNISKKKK
jgi:hypothetical protein